MEKIGCTARGKNSWAERGEGLPGDVASPTRRYEFSFLSLSLSLSKTEKKKNEQRDKEKRRETGETRIKRIKRRENASSSDIKLLDGIV